MEIISCYKCHSKRKNTKSNKIHFEPGLSNIKAGKKVFMCTNDAINPKTKKPYHPTPFFIVIQEFMTKDQLISARNYSFYGVLPEEPKPKKKKSKKR